MSNIVGKKVVTRQYTNAESGEIVTLEHEEELVPRRRPPEDTSDEKFAMFYNASELAKLKMSPLDWRCLMWLVGHAPIGKSAFTYSNNQLAKEVESYPPKTSQAVGRLRSLGLIIDRGDRHVMLNPHYFWKDKPKERRRMLWNIEMGTLPPAIQYPA